MNKKYGMGALIVLAAVVAIGLSLSARQAKTEVLKAPNEPRVIKIKEVVGQVVGGPQIVAGSPLIGYSVYVDEAKGMVALHAKQCPKLHDGQLVVMYQGNSPKSEWYTFLRFKE